MEIYRKKINSFKNFKVKINDLNIHFIKERVADLNHNLLLNHGWPGSILEFNDIIDKQYQKSRGDPEDSFDVIVPHYLVLVFR